MTTQAVREMTLMPKDEQAVSIFERFATDPNVSVEKIERLMALWERGEAKKAEATFNARMSDAQKEMRPIAADAANSQTNSRYASYAALDSRLRPIYTTHGFALSFNTADAKENEVRVLCLVTHESGHTREYHIDMPADGKGAKGGDVMTKTHATGAAVTYGMRYLLKMIFNVAVGEDDTDGNAPAEVPKAPAGFENWMTDFSAACDEGFQTAEQAWKDSKIEYREFATKHYRGKLEEFKKRAKAVRS